MGRLIIRKDKLELDGRDFYLASGDFHYFRCLPGGWLRRLKLMKDFGLTAVQTYVPWNLHEPSPGQFDFTGHLDLGAAWLRKKVSRSCCVRRRTCAANGTWAACRPGC